MLIDKKWDKRFMNIAKEVATWSKDPSTKVGCVIAKGKKFVSLGFNGFPPGIKDTKERLDDRDMRLALTDHAERNSIDFAKEDLTGCTVYVTSHPCALCAKAISKAGVTKVIYLNGTPEFNNRWATDIDLAQIIFNEKRIFHIGIDNYDNTQTRE